MAEPSLSEITGVTVDSERGTGTPAVVFDNRQLIDSITNAANQKAQYDWAKYNQFQKNMADLYQDVNAISKMETASQDKPALWKELSTIYKDIAQDPSIFAGKNPARLAQIQSRLANVTQQSVQSKQDQLYDFAHRQYLAQNPELNNADNQAKVSSYLQTPLGQRQAYTLDLMPTFDPNTLASEVNKNIEQVLDSSRVIGGRDEKGNIIPGDKYFLSQKSKVYDPARFMTQWGQLYDFNQDKRGNTLRQWVDNAYKNADKNLYPTPKDFWNAIGRARIGKEQIVEDDLKANPNAYKEEDLAIKRGQLRVSLGNLGLRQKEYEDKKEGELLSALGVVEEAADAVQRSLTPQNRVSVINENGKEEIVYEMSDPTLIQYFSNIDKDGKTYNVPDRVRVSPDGEKIDLVFFKKDEEGNPIFNKSKGRQIENMVSVTPRTYVRGKISKTFGNAAGGKVNQVAQDILTKNGGSLLEVAKKLRQKEGNINKEPSNVPDVPQGQPNNPPPPILPKEKMGGVFSVNGKKYTHKQLNDLGYTDNEIAEAISLGTIK